MSAKEERARGTPLNLVHDHEWQPTQKRIISASSAISARDHLRVLRELRGKKEIDWEVRGQKELKAESSKGRGQSIERRAKSVEPGVRFGNHPCRHVTSGSDPISDLWPL
jgi:hypothetical protein